MSNATRSARSNILAVVVMAALWAALLPAAHADDSASDASLRPGAPAPAPAFEAHGSIALPTSLTQGVRCPDALTTGATAWAIEGVTPGRVFALRADDATYRNDFDIHFYPSHAACAAGELPLPHTNHAGDENAVVPDRSSIGVVTLKTGSPASFTYTELGDQGFRGFGDKSGVTVVAVIEQTDDFWFSPYHNDFLGSHHPWNTDRDPTNDINFGSHPASYIAGFPDAAPLAITLPTSDGDLVDELAAQDGSTWKGMKAYTDAAPNLYWVPGTKVVATASFGLPVFGAGTAYDKDRVSHNGSHATRAASVAAGNIHGACAECVFVLLGGVGNDLARALRWALKQPWIDVVTNSYVDTDVGVDLLYLQGDGAATKAAVERGQTVVWGAGNGPTPQYSGTPTATYASSQRGPDWIVTVGAVFSQTDQAFRASGKPADIAAYGDAYPSSGGTTANGTGIFNGTSNASPVVAGTFAHVIQRARELVGDRGVGQRRGEVARGPGRPCFRSTFPCPLDDGVLRRDELQAVVFDNVLPSTADLTTEYLEPDLPLLPGGKPAETPSGNDVLYAAFTPPAAFKPAALGHGIVYGRLDQARFVAEQRRLDDALRGAVEPYRRPPGERAWLTADSKCRQRIWGTWDGGYFKSSADPPSFGPDDTVGAAWNALCDALPQDTRATIDPLVQNFEL